MRAVLLTFRLASLVMTACVALCLEAYAGGGPQNLALIVNPDDPDSLAIANYYIELRRIPASNVIYIPWRAEFHATTAIQFRDRIVKPVLAQLTERKLTAQIDYLAFSSGYPYMIDCAPLFRDRQFPRHARPTTSLTSAAFFYKFILNSQPEMFDMNANEYFAPPINGVTTSRSFSAFEPIMPISASGAATEKRYLLSTAIGVTRGHGNSGAEITACLRRAKQADGTRPRGTIYYMQNNNIRSTVRQGEFPAAVRELAVVGVNAVVLPGVTPTNKADVVGLTTGSPHVRLRESRSLLLPGALVDNLTSAGGRFCDKRAIRKRGSASTSVWAPLGLRAQLLSLLPSRRSSPRQPCTYTTPAVARLQRRITSQSPRRFTS
jgi:uncharacterized protein (TIGR03790 family)